MLEERFLQPDDFQFGYFTTTQGVKYRYGWIIPENPRGTIVLLQGFSEFIEKYFETIRDFTAAGYAVYTFDWRGQGKSDRWFEDDPEAVYHTGLGQEAETLHFFVKEIIPHNLRPVYCLGHSMGGHIALLTAQRWADLFDKIVLSAPMIQFSLPKSRFIVRVILKIIRLFGLQKKSALKGGNWTYKNPPLALDPRSRDPVRRLVHYHWCEKDKTLRLGEISFEWVYHALQSVMLMEAKGALETIHSPVLIGVAEHDIIVNNTAIKQAVKRMPNARMMDFPDAHHEILMERDEIRNVFLKAALDFFEGEG